VVIGDAEQNHLPELVARAGDFVDEICELTPLSGRLFFHCGCEGCDSGNSASAAVGDHQGLSNGLHVGSGSGADEYRPQPLVVQHESSSNVFLVPWERVPARGWHMLSQHARHEEVRVGVVGAVPDCSCPPVALGTLPAEDANTQARW